jgi:uncharacterized DUF497 family protein
MGSRVCRFSQHARIKFEILRRHGLSLDEKAILDIVNKPDAIFEGYSGRKIAQGWLDERRVLRVVFEERLEEVLIITFYPGRKERYEKG